ncbi:hypothetical protein BGX28_010141 [Mortierella sp. GBA30]|nr:hypothetical protein BGX28_010141 [Mortierella sp. GBA30]
MIDYVSSSTNYHRRSMSCLAVASHHEHFDHPSFSNRLFDTIEISEDGVATTAFVTGGATGSSASPVQTRHAPRKSDGNISMTQLQKSLSGAGITSSEASSSASRSEGTDGAVSVAAVSLGGKLAKLNPTTPIPRRSLLSDMLNNQSQNGGNSRLEQNAHRRRMLKSMRRYSVDVSEMNFNFPSGRASPMNGIPSESDEIADSAAASNGGGGGAGPTRGVQDFRDTPTVRYLRNPCHAAVKTRLAQGCARRGAGEDGESPDYFGAEDRVW